MTYKTILVHLDNSRHTDDRVRIAVSLALREDNAHLIGAAMTGISQYIRDSVTAAPEGLGVLPYVNDQIMTLRQQAAAVLDKFEAAVKRADVTSFEKRLIEDESFGGISLQARYCDLIVLGQADPDDPASTQMADLPEYVAMTGGRPVLLLPYALRYESVGENVMIAWDASLEATRAVHHALPILKRAGKVKVVVFNADTSPNAHGEEPGADIALYLARHGVNVEVSQESAKIDIGNALLSLCADEHADLLVMGCYGHTRFHELLLGGVSRTILQTMTIPVFIAH
jgi:nucleotide-binding universal stress UspA family protein